MSRQNKEAMVEDIKNKLSSARMIVLTDFKGLSVQQISSLRSRLRREKIDYKVLKNTLSSIAIKNTDYEKLADYLSGPTAWALGYDDSVELPKLIVQFSRDEPNLKIKAGMLGPNLLRADDIRAIADLPPREVLIAKLAGSLKSPIAGLVGVLVGPMRKMLGVLTAVRDQKEKTSQPPS
jgi:large subunit ribosomal protein L10